MGYVMTIGSELDREYLSSRILEFSSSRVLESGFRVEIRFQGEHDGRGA